MLSAFQLWPSCLSTETQKDLIEEIRSVEALAPFFTPRMPRTNKPFSVSMTNCGSFGWVSDKSGYRYQATHPETTAPWPEIPAVLLSLWSNLTGYPKLPEVCLINGYREKARMGLHKDADEFDREAPVLSVSLGDSAIFRMGGRTRKDSTRSFTLASGDVLALAGAERFSYHGVDRICVGTSDLLDDAFPDYRRLNLTLRVVGKSESQQQ